MVIAASITSSVRSSTSTVPKHPISAPRKNDASPNPYRRGRGRPLMPSEKDNAAMNRRSRTNEISSRNDQLTHKNGLCEQSDCLIWSDHSSSLPGDIEALKASTLCLPAIHGARAELQEVKDVVGSAVNVTQAMGAAICSLMSKVLVKPKLV